MKKGLLIVFEGIDGSGKTTQIDLLAKYLSEKNIPYEVISFPQYGKNEYAEKIYEYLSGKLGEVEPYELAKVYADDRKTARDLINSWLGSGKLVIANRYVSSSKAHLSANLVKEEQEEFISWTDQLEYEENGIPREDLTILLKVDPKVGQKNVLGKHGPDIHENDLNHLNRANRIYLRLSKTEPNWVVVDCMVGEQMRSKEDIHEEVVKIISDKLPT